MTASPDTESDLIRRLTAGDQTALEEAFRLYGARCNAVALRILHDAARAEDAVQEAFLTLWRRRSGLVVRTAGVAPWLVVVTRNAALEAWRRDARRSAREERAASETADLAVDTAAGVLAEEAAAQVREALKTLPPEQRQVIDASYFKHRTLAQISQETSTPLGTVKSRARLALARLARVLEPETI